MDAMEPPAFVQIEPVGQCNLRCEMCAIPFRRDGPPWGPPALMKYETFMRILDQLPSIKELHLQGLGEPMMHPRLFDMVAHASRRGVDVSINSNCTLISDARAERMVLSGLKTLHVSIDGAKASTYEAIRVGARLHRVLRGVKLVLRARERLGIARPALRLVAVVMKRNLHELAGLVELAARLEIPAVFVQHLSHDFGEESLPAHYRPMRDYVDRQSLLGEAESRVEEHFARARAAAASAGIDLRLPSVRMTVHPPGTPGRERCDWPWRGAYISYQGLSMPCCMVSTPDRIHFGSVVERGLGPVWNGPDYRRFRADLGSERPPDVCRSCSIYRGTF